MVCITFIYTFEVTSNKIHTDCCRAIKYVDHTNFLKLVKCYRKGKDDKIKWVNLNANFYLANNTGKVWEIKRVE